MLKTYLRIRAREQFVEAPRGDELEWLKLKVNGAARSASLRVLALSSDRQR